LNGNVRVGINELRVELASFSEERRRNLRESLT
jgi:hypothetical protein